MQHLVFSVMLKSQIVLLIVSTQHVFAKAESFHSRILVEYDHKRHDNEPEQRAASKPPIVSDSSSMSWLPYASWEEYTDGTVTIMVLRRHLFITQARYFCVSCTSMNRDAMC